jgi:hypothetical protein
VRGCKHLALHSKYREFFYLWNKGISEDSVPSRKFSVRRLHGQFPKGSFLSSTFHGWYLYHQAWSDSLNSKFLVHWFLHGQRKLSCISQFPPNTKWTKEERKPIELELKRSITGKTNVLSWESVGNKTLVLGTV